MGTIIAVKKDDEIAIGTDSFNLIEINLRPELCVSKGCLIDLAGGYVGLSSSPGYQQAFEAALANLDQKKIPQLTTANGIYEFFLHMHEVLRNHYGMYVNFHTGQEFEWSPMTALLINSAGIFRIDSNRSVFEFSKCWAIGSAQGFAIGAAEALYTSRKTATQIVAKALDVTCKMESLSGKAVEIRTIKYPSLKVAAGSVRSAPGKKTQKKKSLKPVRGGKK